MSSTTHDADTPDVLPLRLLLQPSGLTVVCNRPRLIMGRHRSVDIRLPLPDVSRQHCVLVYSSARGWHVEDLDSLNGIYLNQERIQQAELKPRDLLQVGSFRFEVELPDDCVMLDEVEEMIPVDILRSIAQTLDPIDRQSA